jgi:hypothetical protein
LFDERSELWGTRDKPMLDCRPEIVEARMLNSVTPASVMAAGASPVLSSLSALTI